MALLTRRERRDTDHDRELASGVMIRRFSYKSAPFVTRASLAGEKAFEKSRRGPLREPAATTAEASSEPGRAMSRAEFTAAAKAL